MCRLTLYLGPETQLSKVLVEPENSVIHQSLDAHLGPRVNGDGFGIAWHAPVEGLGRFRSAQPAWNTPNLADLALHVRSSCILAHVRMASPGSAVTEINSHPFRSSDVVMMHNGGIGGFAKIKRALISELSSEAFAEVEGTSDSEHLLALIMTRLAPGKDGEWGQRVSLAVEESLACVARLQRQYDIQDASVYNMVLTNGTSAVSTRFATDPERHSDTLFHIDGDSVGLHLGRLHVGHQGERRCSIVSSEPLNDDPNWREVPNGTILRTELNSGTTSHPMSAVVLQ